MPVIYYAAEEVVNLFIGINLLVVQLHIQYKSDDFNKKESKNRIVMIQINEWITKK